MLTVEAIEENLSLQIQEDDISLTMQIADSAPSGVVVSGAPGNVLQTIPDGLYVPGPAEMPGFSSVGRTVATGTAAQGRGALGLGTAAQRNSIGSAALYGRDSVVGTVSQSGGIPTGAILQRGSNSNGFFLRSAEGWQRAFALAETPAVTGPDIWGEDFTFPATFLNIDSIAMSLYVGSGSDSNPSQVTAVLRSFSPSGGRVVFRNALNTTLILRAYIVAEGRWF